MLTIHPAPSALSRVLDVVVGLGALNWLWLLLLALAVVLASTAFLTRRRWLAAVAMLAVMASLLASGAQLKQADAEVREAVTRRHPDAEYVATVTRTHTKRRALLTLMVLVPCAVLLLRRKGGERTAGAALLLLGGVVTAGTWLVASRPPVLPPPTTADEWMLKDLPSLTSAVLTAAPDMALMWCQRLPTRSELASLPNELRPNTERAWARCEREEAARQQRAKEEAWRTQMMSR